MSNEIVVPDDFRSNKNETCFYCSMKLGEPHKEECVIPQRIVMIKETIIRPISVPKNWEPHSIDFQRQGSSWCANNIADEIHRQKENFCLCSSYTGEYLREAEPGDLEGWTFDTKEARRA